MTLFTDKKRLSSLFPVYGGDQITSPAVTAMVFKGSTPVLTADLGAGTTFQYILARSCADQPETWFVLYIGHLDGCPHADTAFVYDENTSGEYAEMDARQAFTENLEALRRLLQENGLAPSADYYRSEAKIEVFPGTKYALATTMETESGFGQYCLIDGVAVASDNTGVKFSEVRLEGASRLGRNLAGDVRDFDELTVGWNDISWIVPKEL